VQQQGLAADRQRALKPSGSQQARAHALAQVQQLHKLASASGQGSLEKSSWVGQPQSHGAGADGDSASSGQPAFWGGSGPARHQLLSEYVAQMAGRTSQTGRRSEAFLIADPIMCHVSCGWPPTTQCRRPPCMPLLWFLIPPPICHCTKTWQMWVHHA
jgi:hypothetical protein